MKIAQSDSKPTENAPSNQIVKSADRVCQRQYSPRAERFGSRNWHAETQDQLGKIFAICLGILAEMV